MECTMYHGQFFLQPTDAALSRNSPSMYGTVLDHQQINQQHTKLVKVLVSLGDYCLEKCYRGVWSNFQLMNTSFQMTFFSSFTFLLSPKLADLINKMQYFNRIILNNFHVKVKIFFLQFILKHGTYISAKLSYLKRLDLQLVVKCSYLVM